MPNLRFVCQTMGLIPLRLATALEPVNVERWTTLATPCPERASVKTILSDYSSTSYLSSKLPRNILHLKSGDSSSLPYGDDEWRLFLDEVKELFQNGLFKQCSDRCVTALEEVRGPVHPTHITYVSFYAAICITIQAESPEVSISQKVALLALSLSFFERSEGFLMQAKKEQVPSSYHFPKQEGKKSTSTPSAQCRSAVSGSSFSKVCTIDPADLDFSPLTNGLSCGGKQLDTLSYPAKREDYKNLLYSTFECSKSLQDALAPTRPLPTERAYKRSASESSSHSRNSSINSVMDDSQFSLPWDTGSCRSSVSSCTSTSSKTTPEIITQQRNSSDIEFLYLKPPILQRSRKRAPFAPSLPTIISDSCISGARMDAFNSSLTEMPPQNLNLLHLLLLSTGKSSISTKLEIPNSLAVNISRNSIESNRIQASGLGINPILCHTPGPVPFTAPLRRPLPPLPRTICQPLPRYRLNFSKPRPAPLQEPRTPPEITMEATPVHVFSQSHERYNAHIPTFLARIRYHIIDVRKTIADLQLKMVEAGKRPVKTISVKELREGTGWAKGVKWKVDKEEIVRRVRRARVVELKRRGQEYKAWDGKRCRELCLLTLDELGK